MKFLTLIEICLVVAWVVLAILGIGETIDFPYLKELMIGVLPPMFVTTGLKAKKAKEFTAPKNATEITFSKVEVRWWIVITGILYSVIAFLPNA
ncbi:hypothetical protein [Thermoflexibacter ruber]|nr:hypothetical protein [Thermoflexibacter ruber]